eukprot:499630-Hanusia_phi.AAC.1
MSSNACEDRRIRAGGRKFSHLLAQPPRFLHERDSAGFLLPLLSSSDGDEGNLGDGREARAKMIEAE